MCQNLKFSSTASYKRGIWGRNAAMGDFNFLFRALELPTRAIGELHHGTNPIWMTDILAVPTPVELTIGKESTPSVDKHSAA